ncbi:glycoprotein 3-alpha-L-fucosyltransferase A-like [Anneissia japonica]|uniref:glycoprotein 3-alpha-L-fucosyltransferase A-like n=1 Tax=Anneissia japonica TaxID=1529436 RepID=UPI0014254C36|nr:glycoprotein 3-alpha-L-fucosyltransferase A-like [Anneissia japonica]
MCVSMGIRRIFTLKKVLLTVVFSIAVIAINYLRPESFQRNDVENNIGLIHHVVKKYDTKTNLKISNGPKEILIFGELRMMKTWSELSSMIDCFKDPKTKSLRNCSVFCPLYNESISLTLGIAADYGGKDAIVFGISPFTLRRYHKEVFKQFPPNVLTVFYSMESPYRVSKWIWPIPTGRYHVTMTYLTASNITIPYSYYKPFAEETVSENRNFAKGKTKLIAWMGSNCREVFWPRLEFIKQLQAHISIDMYGKCGNLTCLPRLSEKCVYMLRKYKFYLAFENSECHEYLTEKMWKTSLANEVVPIVYGPSRADYDKFAPPKSYIHVSDFKNVKELADYIELLDKNDDLYNSYFDWKTRGRVVNVYPEMQPSYFCEILAFLGKNIPQERKPLSQSVWFNSCRNPIKKRFNPDKRIRFENWSPWL